MNLLETLYGIKLKNSLFFDRKIKITHKKTLLLGPRKSGKTHLIIDYLQNFDANEYLYIDFGDARVDKSEIDYQKLKSFIVKNSIKLLVLENFNLSFEIPPVDEIIITSSDKALHVENFKRLFLYPLDFEEFIAFNKKFLNAEQLFSIYSNRGSLPDIILFNEENYLARLQKIAFELFDSKQEYLIFKKFCELQSTKASLFQIYNQLKTKTKISKDLIYNTSKKLQNHEIIFFLEKYAHQKATKKIYLFDFAIKNALTYKKDFLKRFENMVFAELYKKNEKLFYSDYLDFYIPQKNEGIICSPFTPIENLKPRLKKYLNHFLSLKVENIRIITIGNEEKFSMKDISFEQITFWDWALGD